MRAMTTATAALALVLGAGGLGGAQDRPGAVSLREQVVDEFIHLLNGTWSLRERLTPDGQPHAGTLAASLRIDLVRQPSKLIGARAIGRVTSEERGVWDARIRSQVPREVFGQPFVIETSGLWEVAPTAESLARAAGNEIDFTVAQVSVTKASFAPCTDGLVAQTDIKFRLSRRTTDLSLALLERLSPARSTTFRGRRVPQEWAAPVTLGNAPVRSDDWKRCGREYVTLTVAGGRMLVVWDGGVREVWTRTDAAHVAPL